MYSPVGEISGPPEGALPCPPDAVLGWLPDAASCANEGEIVPMINAMDTTTHHPDDLVRMPYTPRLPRTASTPQGLLNDLLECLNYARKSPGIAHKSQLVYGNCTHFATLGAVFAKPCLSCYFLPAIGPCGSVSRPVSLP